MHNVVITLTISSHIWTFCKHHRYIKYMLQGVIAGYELSVTGCSSPADRGDPRDGLRSHSTGCRRMKSPRGADRGHPRDGRVGERNIGGRAGGGRAALAVGTAGWVRRCRRRM